MRQSREAKAETYRAIVAEAARMFRERGVGQTSVVDVMQAADRTHGGFYRHFATKDELLGAALAEAFAQMVASLERGVGTVDRSAALQAFLDYYLSAQHVDEPGTGCPIAALAGDLAHGSDALKAEFGAGVRTVIAKLAAALDGPQAERHVRAARAFAMAAGAVMIARATDPQTGEQVLAAARLPEVAEGPFD